MFQETIEIKQIRRLDGHVRRRGKLDVRACQVDHGLGRERLILDQQAPQGVIHGRFVVAGRVLQNPQVRAAGDFGRVFVPQPVVGHPKAAVGE